VGQLGANAQGEVLKAGRVPDCYFGVFLEPADDGQDAGVLGRVSEVIAIR
jgi:hypothetical protein